MKSGTTVSDMKKYDLEKIQIEAARITAGTTKLVSMASLYSERISSDKACHFPK